MKKINKKKLIKFIFNSFICIACIGMIIYFFYMLAIYPYIKETTTGLTAVGSLEFVLCFLVLDISYENIKPTLNKLKK